VAWIAYTGTLAVSLAGVALVVGAPWFRAHGHDDAGVVLYEAFRPVCHQDPLRSFHMWGHALAVCSRCSALLFGGVFGLLLVPLLRSVDAGLPRRRWLALAALPCVLDVVLGWAGVPNSFWSRTVSGGLLGAATAFYLVPAMVAAARELVKTSNNDGGGAVGEPVRNP
jgi:uncharacterized membrane protein